MIKRADDPLSSPVGTTRPSLLAAVLSLALGCFSDPPPLQGTTGEETECPMGATGCACNGNGTCDVGLECATLLDRCVPDDCDPGALGCVCAGTECLTGLHCVEGLCVEPSADSSTGHTAMDATDGGVATSGLPQDGSGDAPSSSATSSELDAGTEASGGSDCTDGCDACQACIDDHVAAGACSPPSNACTGECGLLRDCLGDERGTQACCGAHPDGVEHYQTLLCCALIACPVCSESSCIADFC